MNLVKKKFSLAIRVLGVIGLIQMAMSCQQQQQGSRMEMLPYYGDPTFTPHWLRPSDEILQNFHRVAAFELINQNGDTLTSHDLKDKIYVADFFFTTCPGICPKMTDNMSLLQEAFLKDDLVVLLSHSVTPERDSVPVLQAYAEEKGIISQKWHLLTGERKNIYELGRNQYFIEEDLGMEKTTDDFLHTENFVLVDGDRRIRGIYNGLNKSAVEQLISDIYMLKKEGLAF